VEWQGELAAASELIDRGLAIGPRRPLLQAQVSGYFGASWSASLAASVQDNRLDNTRVLARLGRSWSLSNDWQAEAGLGYYAYPGDARYRSFDRSEFGVSASFRDLLSLGLTAIHYPAWPGSRAGLHWAMDIGLRWPLAENWSATASLGRADAPMYSSVRYTYAGLGLAWQQGAWRAELNRLGASASSLRWAGDLAQWRWSATIARNF
jgi:hypothetical protein